MNICSTKLADVYALFARVVPKARSRQQQIICLWFCVQSFIPKSLDQVEDYERDQQRLACGKDTEGIYYQTITGLKADLSGVRQGPSLLENPTSAQPSVQNSADLRSASHDDSGQIGALDTDSEDDEDSLVGGDDDEFEGVSLVKDLKEEPACVAGDNNAISEGSEEDSSDDEDDEEGPSNDPKKEAARLARKEHKKKVKAEKRESRKVKVPKAQKKKKKKLAKAKCTR